MTREDWNGHPSEDHWKVWVGLNNSPAVLRHVIGLTQKKSTPDMNPEEYNECVQKLFLFARIHPETKDYPLTEDLVGYVLGSWHE